MLTIPEIKRRIIPILKDYADEFRLDNDAVPWRGIPVPEPESLDM